MDGWGVVERCCVLFWYCLGGVGWIGWCIYVFGVFGFGFWCWFGCCCLVEVGVE